MALKKAKAKRAAPKGKPKAKLKAATKARQAKARSKRIARPATKRRVPKPAAVRPPLESSPALTMPVVGSAPPGPPKKGPLARFAGGVGSLFARVTGKRALIPSTDQTIEIATGDILAVTAAPPPLPKPKS